MLIAGLMLRNIPYINVVGRKLPPEYANLLRTMALIVLLLRAGLGLDPTALRKLSHTVVLLAVAPMLLETSVVAICSYYFIPSSVPGFTKSWAVLTGFVLTAVSPAIIVPEMLQLQKRQLGTAKGIPTLALAAAALDNVLAIVGVGLAIDYVFKKSTSLERWWQNMYQGPLEIVIGILYGVIVGLALWRVRASHETRTWWSFGLLSGLGTFAVFGARRIGLGGAGTLACLVLAFVAGFGWRKKKSELSNTPDDNQNYTVHSQVSTMLSSMWLIVFQPLLFAFIGSAVSFDVINWNVVLVGMGVLAMGLFVRTLATVAALSWRSNLNWREKTFICIAWSTKASVQAALGPLAYDLAIGLQDGSNDSESVKQTVECGLTVLTLAVTSIMLTAPAGAIGLKWSAVPLLGKRTKASVDNRTPELTSRV